MIERGFRAVRVVRATTSTSPARPAAAVCWASGKPLHADNEERLMRLLATVGATDRGSAPGTRVALLDASDGTSALEMLAAERFRDARAALGQGRAAPLPARTRFATRVVSRSTMHNEIVEGQEALAVVRKLQAAKAYPVRDWYDFEHRIPRTPGAYRFATDRSGDDHPTSPAPGCCGQTGHLE